MSKKATTKKATTNRRSINDFRAKMSKLLKRKDGVSVAEAIDATGLCKKSVRKLFAELNAQPTDYIGYYKS